MYVSAGKLTVVVGMQWPFGRNTIDDEPRRPLQTQGWTHKGCLLVSSVLQLVLGLSQFRLLPLGLVQDFSTLFFARFIGQQIWPGGSGGYAAGEGMGVESAII